MAIILAASFNLITYSGGAMKDIAVAYYFGRSAELDVFLLSMTVFVFILNSVGGSIGAATLPVFMLERDRRGPAAGTQLVNHVTFLTCLILAASGALAALVIPAVLSTVAHEFSAGQAELARVMILLLVPALVLGGMTSIWGPTLNAHGRYMVAATTPVFGPVATLALLLVMGSALGPSVLAFGIVAGSLLEVVSLGLYMRALGLRVTPQWGRIDPSIRRIFNQTMPLVMASCFSMGATLIDQAMAASLGSGAISALSYGSKVVTMLLGLATVSLTSVLFPQFAQLSVSGDLTRLRAMFLRYLVIVAIVCAVGMAGVIAFSTPIIQLVFQHGAFSEQDTRLVGNVQALFALQLPFHVGGILAVRLLNALHRNQTLILVSAINLFVDVVANYGLMQLLGVAGIALATSVVFLFSFVILLVATLRALSQRTGTTHDRDYW